MTNASFNEEKITGWEGWLAPAQLANLRRVMNDRYRELDITPELLQRRKYDEYFIRGQIVAICDAILGEYVSVIAGACELNRLGFELLDELDEDFKIFWVIDSETDHLPIGRERQNWHPEALIEKEDEIRRVEEFYSQEIRDACKRLLTRFGRYAPGTWE